MTESRYEAAMNRRTLLARLATIAASYAGLTAFSRPRDRVAQRTGVG